MASLARQCATAARRVSVASTVRTFATTTAPRKDFVQNLYLQELKNYKPSGNASSQAGQVRDFSMPSAPQAPAVPTGQELSKEMDAWEAVKVGEVNPEGATKGETETGRSPDEFLSMCEADHPAPEHH